MNKQKELHGTIATWMFAAGIFLALVLSYVLFIKQGTSPPAPNGDGDVPSADNTSQTLQTYTDPQYGFSFMYDSGLLTLGDAKRSVPPDYTETVSGVRLIKQIPIEHCGLSGLPGSCTPETDNINIGFFVVNQSFDALTVPLKESLGDIVKDITIGGKKGVFTELGVEGEGLFEYYLPLGTDHTLLIARSYMNEDILGNYKNSDIFIKYAEQAKIFEDVVKTLSFQ